MEIKEVKPVLMKDIIIDELNVRTENADEDIDELAESIKIHGLMQPIVLNGVEGHPPYKVIIGQRRFLAHQKLKENYIKATFTGKIKPLEATLLSLAENMQRVQLNHADKAKAITELYLNHYQKNEKKVAKALGISPATVREYVNIEEQATPKAKRLLQSRKISKQDVKRVITASQGDSKKADELIEELEKLTKYQKERAVEIGKNNPSLTAKQITTKAKEPKITYTVVLNLSEAVENALSKAKDKLFLDKEVIAMNALNEWLDRNGFLKDND